MDTRKGILHLWKAISFAVPFSDDAFAVLFSDDAFAVLFSDDALAALFQMIQMVWRRSND